MSLDNNSPIRPGIDDFGVSTNETPFSPTGAVVRSGQHDYSVADTQTPPNSAITAFANPVANSVMKNEIIDSFPDTRTKPVTSLAQRGSAPPAKRATEVATEIGFIAFLKKLFGAPTKDVVKIVKNKMVNPTPLTPKEKGKIQDYLKDYAAIEKFLDEVRKMAKSDNPAVVQLGAQLMAMADDRNVEATFNRSSSISRPRGTEGNVLKLLTTKFESPDPLSQDEKDMLREYFHNFRPSNAVLAHLNNLAKRRIQEENIPNEVARVKAAAFEQAAHGVAQTIEALKDEVAAERLPQSHLFQYLDGFFKEGKEDKALAGLKFINDQLAQGRKNQNVDRVIQFLDSGRFKELSDKWQDNPTLRVQLIEIEARRDDIQNSESKYRMVKPEKLSGRFMIAIKTLATESKKKPELKSVFDLLLDNPGTARLHELVHVDQEGIYLPLIESTGPGSVPEIIHRVQIPYANLMNAIFNDNIFRGVPITRREFDLLKNALNDPEVAPAVARKLIELLNDPATENIAMQYIASLKVNKSVALAIIALHAENMKPFSKNEVLMLAGFVLSNAFKDSKNEYENAIRKLGSNQSAQIDKAKHTLAVTKIGQALLPGDAAIDEDHILNLVEQLLQKNAKLSPKEISMLAGLLMNTKIKNRKAVLEIILKPITNPDNEANQEVQQAAKEKAEAIFLSIKDARKVIINKALDELRANQVPGEIEDLIGSIFDRELTSKEEWELIEQYFRNKEVQLEKKLAVFKQLGDFLDRHPSVAGELLNTKLTNVLPELRKKIQ